MATTLVRIEDTEGDGDCQACDREGLRWIAILSDGSRVGLECAKTRLGYRPTPATYTWVSDYEPIGEHTEHGEVWALWQAKDSDRTALSRDGRPVQFGGAREVWARRGWC